MRKNFSFAYQIFKRKEFSVDSQWNSFVFYLFDLDIYAIFAACHICVAYSEPGERERIRIPHYLFNFWIFRTVDNGKYARQAQKHTHTHTRER